MTDTEQPSQWAVDMLNDILSIWGPLGDNAAAFALQRAFAEREAELVGALRWIAENYENGRINHVDFRVQAKHLADAALKSREADHAG